MSHIMSCIGSGYGICITNLEGVTTEGFESLLKRAPKCLRDEIAEKLEDAKQDEDVGCGESPDIDDYLGIAGVGEHFNSPVAALLQAVIKAETSINLSVFENCSGEYLLFQASYPWRMSETERGLSEEDVVNLFGRYVSILTDKPLYIKYFDIVED